MTLTGHGLRVIEEIALNAVAVAVGRFQDAHLVAAVLVHHCRDAGGVVGAVRLKGAGAQSVREALAPAHEVVDGVGLVAVGHDLGPAQRQHGVIDDEAGVFQLVRVGGHGADAAPLRDGVEHAVAAVLAAAHDEIADEHLPPIRGHGHRDAAAGVLVGCQILVQIDFLHKVLLYSLPQPPSASAPSARGPYSLPP